MPYCILVFQKLPCWPCHVDRNVLCLCPVSGRNISTGNICWLKLAFIVARIIMDRETGRSRGFGFVTYVSSEGASSAIQALDGQVTLLICCSSFVNLFVCKLWWIKLGFLELLWPSHSKTVAKITPKLPQWLSLPPLMISPNSFNLACPFHKQHLSELPFHASFSIATAMFTCVMGIGI